MAFPGLGLAPISSASRIVLLPEPFGPTRTTRGVRSSSFPSWMPRKPLISMERIMALLSLPHRAARTGFLHRHYSQGTSPSQRVEDRAARDTVPAVPSSPGCDLFYIFAMLHLTQRLCRTPYNGSKQMVRQGTLLKRRNLRCRLRY